jgi:hypothetical protein
MSEAKEVAAVVSGDETFERFRRTLADAVTVAINSGKRVGADHYCPIACFGETNQCKPPAGFVRQFLTFQLPNGAPTVFTEGFDGHEMTSYRGVDSYYRLGQLYRARFP